MTDLKSLLSRFLADERGSVQPELIALTVSGMLLGVTYLETQRAAEENPPVQEETYVRKCAHDAGAADTDAFDRSRFFCQTSR